ncbi:MAG: rRNA maturation RNase YbeY [bacterium]
MPLIAEINIGRYPVNKKIIQRIVDKCDNFLKIKDNILSVAFVSNKEIRRLNKIYRKIDKVTDVLSFGKFHKKKFFKGSDHPFTEIVISYQQAKKQAVESKIKINQEIEKLLIHGFLHLAGFDHETAREAKEMEGLESKIDLLSN